MNGQKNQSKPLEIKNPNRLQSIPEDSQNKSEHDEVVQDALNQNEQQDRNSVSSVISVRSRESSPRLSDCSEGFQPKMPEVEYGNFDFSDKKGLPRI